MVRHTTATGRPARPMASVSSLSQTVSLSGEVVRCSTKEIVCRDLLCVCVFAFCKLTTGYYLNIFEVQLLSWVVNCSYEGDWKDDLRHGSGKEERKDGTHYDGQFE